MINLILPVAAAFLLAFLLLLWMTHGGFASQVLDHPNERSLHTRPVARTGGLAIVAGIACGWLLLAEVPLSVLLAAIFLAALSFVDDLRGLPVLWRLLAHISLCSGFVWTMQLPGIYIVPALLALVWMTNLYNFMDGSDGLAGGMALFGFGSYGYAACLQGDLQFATLNWVISGAAMAFLFFNFHPARIFMGDAGSIPLGFLASVFGLVGWERNLWPLWLPVLVFSPFIVDAGLTLLKRLLRREKIWLAHREHYYQRLVRMGWGHRNTALAEYALMVATGGTAIWAIEQGDMVWIRLITVWGAVYFVIIIIIDNRWSQQRGRRPLR